MKKLIVALLSLLSLVVRAQQIDFSTRNSDMKFEAYSSSLNDDSLELNITVKFESNVLLPRTNRVLWFDIGQKEILVRFSNTCILLDCRNSEYYERVSKGTVESYRFAIPKKRNNYQYHFDFSFISENGGNYSIYRDRIVEVSSDLKRSVGLEAKNLITLPVDIERKLVSSISGSLSVNTN